MIQIATILLLVASSAFATTFSPCNGVAPPISLDVEGCNKEPCQLIRGEDVIGHVKFTAVNTKTLTALIKATTNGVTVNFPLPQPDACESLTAAECPLTAGEKVTYTINMPVLALYPKVSLLLELNLTDDNNKSVTCFKLQAKVVDRTE